MKVLISGSNGFIGSALVAALQARGDSVARVARHSASGTIDANSISVADAVVHLAGARIGGRRWTAREKAKILGSRVDGARALAQGVCRLDRPPKTFISASAVGYYGTRGDEVLTEESAGGSGFRSQVCRRWEESADLASKCGARVVKLRSGLVFGRGGLLPFLSLPARLGFSLQLGDGFQYWSWISLTDEVRAIMHLLDDNSIEGPVNLVSPHPLQQALFAAELRRVVGRGWVTKVPTALIRLGLGREQADEVLLSSLRVIPQKLTRSGFVFGDSDMGPCLRRILTG